jgi:phosphonate transport system substrate-binding protein
MIRRTCRLAVVALTVGAAGPAFGAPNQTYYFGVLNQRSVALTARFWNPILEYVGRTSGVPLVLKMGKTAVDTTEMTVRGEFAFVYTNHLFTPERAKLRYRVIARTTTPSIRATIVVPENSSLKSLKELDGKAVAFPSREAFVGYWVPMDALLRSGVRVNPSYAGNQEGAMAQLQAGTVEAAAVNALELESYARRVGFRYRALWKSEGYHNLPIMANPAVPADKVDAVRKAFVEMSRDPEGARILRSSSELLRFEVPIAFIPANDSDYGNYRRLYQTTVVKAGGSPTGSRRGPRATDGAVADSPTGSRPLPAIPGLRGIRASGTSAGPRATDGAVAD